LRHRLVFGEGLFQVIVLVVVLVGDGLGRLLALA
jgi:hypothetical protein